MVKKRLWRRKRDTEVTRRLKVGRRNKIHAKSMGLSKRNQTPIEPMVNQMVLLEIKGRVIRHP